MTGNRALRQALDVATEVAGTPASYAHKIERLRVIFGHSIEIELGDVTALRKYNCHAFTFGISEDARFLALVETNSNSALLNSTLVLSFENQGILTGIASSDIEIGNIVVYSADGQITHTGIVSETLPTLTVRSKWGPNEIHRHPLWEVPKSYGDNVRYFKALDIELTLKALMQKYSR